MNKNKILHKERIEDENNRVKWKNKEGRKVEED